MPDRVDRWVEKPSEREQAGSNHKISEPGRLCDPGEVGAGAMALPLRVRLAPDAARLARPSVEHWSPRRARRRIVQDCIAWPARKPWSNGNVGRLRHLVLLDHHGKVRRAPRQPNIFARFCVGRVCRTSIAAQPQPRILQHVLCARPGSTMQVKDRAIRARQRRHRPARITAIGCLAGDADATSRWTATPHDLVKTIPPILFERAYSSDGVTDWSTGQIDRCCQ